MTHGTLSRYNRGCRCLECTAAKRDYRPPAPGDADHGKPKSYQYGCRCEKCREVWRVYRLDLKANPRPKKNKQRYRHGTVQRWETCRCAPCCAVKVRSDQVFATMARIRQEIDVADRSRIALLEAGDERGAECFADDIECAKAELRRVIREADA